jgi:cyclase
MKPLTANVLVETEQRGSNHGLVTTSDGLVLIDGPHKPSDALRLKAEIERRGRLRYILNTDLRPLPTRRPSAPTKQQRSEGAAP